MINKCSSKKDPHPDPFVCWHRQVFYPCHSSKHAFADHSSPKYKPEKFRK